MKRTLFFGMVAALAGACVMADAADWNQWRGPERNGVVADSPALLDALPAGGLKPTWQSERILGEEEGGFGSVSVADGKVYVFSNWQYKVPIETRTLRQAGLDQIGWRKGMPRELLAKVEAARLSDERKNQDRRALRNWINNWISKNVSREQRQFRNICYRRLSLAQDALPADVCARLEAILGREFPNEQALDTWLQQNAADEAWRAAIKRVIRTDVDRAHDRAFCLDAATGKTIWQTRVEGAQTVFSSSSTPCITGGRVYIEGSGRNVFCLDAATGTQIWQAKSPESARGTLASSFVVQDGVAVLLAGALVGFDADTGEMLWSEREVSGTYASATYWRTGDRLLLVCNGNREVFCFEAKTGEIIWRVPGGGWSTPTIAGDVMVVCTNRKEIGTVAYKLALPQPRELWRAQFTDRGTSPVIHEGYVYIIGGAGQGKAMCLDLATGKATWEQRLPTTEIGSPVVAAGKLFHIVGTSLYMIEATPERYNLLGKNALNTTRCITPALVDGRLYLRLKEAVTCYDLRKTPR